MIPKFIKKFFIKEKKLTSNISELDFDTIMDQLQEETDRLLSMPYSSANKITSPPTYTITTTGTIPSWIPQNTSTTGTAFTYTITDDWITFGPNYSPLNLTQDDFEEMCKLANEHPCMHEALEHLKITYELVRKQKGISE